MIPEEFSPHCYLVSVIRVQVSSNHYKYTKFLFSVVNEAMEIGVFSCKSVDRLKHGRDLVMSSGSSTCGLASCRTPHRCVQHAKRVTVRPGARQVQTLHSQTVGLPVLLLLLLQLLLGLWLSRVQLFSGLWFPRGYSVGRVQWSAIQRLFPTSMCICACVNLCA